MIDLPGWYLWEADEATVITDGKNALEISPVDSTDIGDPAAAIEALSESGLLDATMTGRQGERVKVTLSVDGEPMTGWVRVVRCPTASAFVMAYGTSPEDLDILYEQVSKARCLRDGESEQEWPPATPTEE